MRKFLAAILICAIIFSLTGCENKNAQNSTISKTSVKSQAKPEIFTVTPMTYYNYPDTTLFETHQVEQIVFTDKYAEVDMPYCLILPKNYDKSKKYPLFLFLHGMGERGNDNYRHLSIVNNMYHTATEYLESAIVVVPQCPADADWSIHRFSGDYNGPLSTVRRIIEDVSSKYSADSSRYYIMGMSMGGYGTWRMVAAYSDMFAAAVPICGGGNPDDAKALCKTPIWIYHGDCDDIVPFYSSEQMYNAIVDYGGTNIKFTQLIGGGHNAWDYAVGDTDMHEWMFSQTK